MNSRSCLQLMPPSPRQASSPTNSPAAAAVLDLSRWKTMRKARQPFRPLTGLNSAAEQSLSARHAPCAKKAILAVATVAAGVVSGGAAVVGKVARVVAASDH